MERSELLFGAATDPGQVSTALEERYALRIDAPTLARWTCLDTADWRLHRTGMTLRDARQGRRGQLLLSWGARESVTAPSPARHWPRRVDTLPDSPVRRRIAPAVGVRALLPLAEVDVRSLMLRVIDDEDKTRVRVRVDQQRVAGVRRTVLPLRVVVTPLRGYERDGQRCAELLGESIGALAEADTSATVAFVAAGHMPGQPAVPPPGLDPQAPAVKSLALVLRRWIDVIDSVRPGVLADIDIEYLHDMRTAVRATRSVLRLAEDLLSDSRAAQLAAEFSWLAELTTPLRDLDVSLLELDGRGDTDLRGIDHLEPLRKHLAKQRRRALRTVRAGLESERGTRLSANWHAAVTALAAPTAVESEGPSTRAVAGEQARVAYRRIVKAAAHVTADTPPEELHGLRRRCKRMRYLLDSYASVYPAGPHREVLSALKSLQDCLGAIQDVDVQRQQLSDLAATLTRAGTSAETVLAMGALRDRSLRRDAAARRVLARRLERFCGPVTRDRVRELAAAGP
ncbi:MAG TPA: CHAD domain-containing protein [Jatrophihabitantaceae bacterium]